MSDVQTSARRRRQAPEARRRFAISPDSIKGPLAVLGGLLILAGGSYYIIFQGFDTTARLVTAAGILLLGVAIAIDPEALWSKLTTRNMRYGGNTLAVAAIFIGILVLVNVLGARRPERWDLTANKALSLSDETIQVLGQIPQPVHAVSFMQFEDTRRTEIENQLYEMQVRSNGNLTYEVVDPREAPGYAQQLGVLELGTTVFVMGDKRQQVSGTREADLTTGLIKLVQPNPRKAYFTTGHQEHRIDGFDQDSYGQVKSQLESRNFAVENLSLFTTPEVPPDASMVVVAGPRVPFTDAEIQALGEYLDRGGDLMIMVDPGVDTGLAPLLSRWGIEAGKLYVVEGDPRFSARTPFIPFVDRMSQHKVTEKLGLPVVFLIPTYLTAPAPGQAPQGWRVATLAQTTDRGWAETDESALRNPQSVKFDEGVDLKGPMTLAVAVEQNPDPANPSAEASAETPPKARVLVFGTSRMATNEVFQLGGQIANLDLFVNGASWLVGDDELISIRPRPADTRTLVLSTAQRNFIMLSSIVLVPALVLAVGILIWWGRR
jgi:gliding motility-associatede transport system auxiliary component